jgi:hypothetical protein
MSGAHTPKLAWVQAIEDAGITLTAAELVEVEAERERLFARRRAARISRIAAMTMPMRGFNLADLAREEGGSK